MRRPTPILFLALTVTLSACGKSETKGPVAPVEKAIYISAADCEDGGKLTADDCGRLINNAVQMHEKTAPTFKSLRSCEEASGLERCENTVTGNYRMRLQAFMVTTTKPIAAAPLYPSDGGKIGFRDDKKADIDARSDAFTVSNAALTVAHENARIAKNVRVKK